MKEITRIHLARTPFNAEIDAKKALEKYLDAIQKTLSADDDTMREIEARIIEILAERGATGEHVITSSDVEAIETRLGSPSDFVDEVDTEAVASGRSQKSLMRDTEQGLLGGVCAGIASYFGINAMWTRLAAILLTLVSFGTGVVVYAVLWLVIPPAKTAADKLQMRGEPVTLASLKAETSEVATNVIERSKPLVIVLRVLLGLGFVLAAFGAIGLIIATIFVREPLFGTSMHDLITSSTLGILGGAYVAAIAAGLLFAVLMVLSAYASFAWMVNKKMLVSGAIIVVLGLASFVTAVGLGSYGVDQVHQRIAELQTSQTNAAAELKNMKTVEIDNTSNVPVDYIATNDTPHITTEYLKGYQKPTVKTMVNNGTAHIAISGTSDCQNSARFACLGYESVTIYGPAAANLTATKGDLNYTADQDAMVLQVNSDAAVTLDGSTTTLQATVAADASFDAGGAAIHSVQVNLQQNATANFGTVVDLTATVPEACGAGSSSALTYAGVTNLKVNNQDGDSGRFHTMHTLPFTNCAQIEQDE